MNRFSLADEALPEHDALEQAALALSYRLLERPERTTSETYYDDPDGALAARGLYLCRVLEGGKSLARLGRRDAGAPALELPSTSGWPRAFGRRLADLCRAEALRSTLELRTTARPYGLERDGVLQADLVLLRFEASASASEGSVSFLELEYSPKSTHEAERAEMRAMLDGLMRLQPTSSPRLARVEALLSLAAGF